MRYIINTLGCKVNQYETQAMEQELLARGHTLTEFSDEADAYIVNTCSVTAVSDQKSRQVIHGVQRKHPGAVVAVCGCYPQTHADDVRKLGVDLISGTGDRTGFIRLLEEAAAEKRQIEAIDQPFERRVFEVLPAGGLGGRTRAMLKVEDGCVNFCTYCIVPYVRGRERSREPGDILAEFKQLIEQGYKEITLLGQNVNSYGKGLASPIDFADLLNLLCEVPGDYQIRFMTSHPKDASHKLIDTIAAQPHLCKHIHLPVQSGSDRLLQQMNRHYTAQQYRELIDYAREKIPGVTFSSDIIVGFPGETEEDFLETMDVVEQVRYDSAFTFIYSKRTGTPAAAMENQIPEEVVKDRFDRLLAKVQEIGREMSSRDTGTIQEVLVEEQNSQDTHLMTGRLSNNLLVHFPGDVSLLGQICQVRLDECRGFYYMGTNIG